MKTLAITIGVFRNQVYAYRLRQGEVGQVHLELGLKQGQKVWEWRPWKEGSLDEMRTLYQTLQSHDRGRWLKVE
ncbi:hypothetical protein [Meiothermus ruber]|uniref:Uncharacterized protein n=1 Tax=Meiothermus ruber (strain ATCC 35948 / DSM 1279 / VKM B-1258 / 21) TaxID=504728 RepID=D3PNE3_MEIRD|nr:hypothetical protein [Meiothermus ruber]ADD27334.1 hypothetical protein Mrub_0561 [Meiothermus ruber DSM 1279]AGK03790.1 hypothetical protein K649_02440 [Meiothermus ruber DSM 1279]